MDVMNPLADKVLFPHSGTFSANPITMTAGLVAMELFDEAAVARLNALSQRAMRRHRGAIEATGDPACVTGGGLDVPRAPQSAPPRNYREAFMTPEENRQLKRAARPPLRAGLHDDQHLLGDDLDADG